MSQSTTAARNSGARVSRACWTSASKWVSLKCWAGLGSREASRSAASSPSASKRMRWRRRTMSRKRLVVIRCSQPSNVPGVYVDSERKTRTKTSWVRSSASCWLPVSR